jgi:hypothetical protein
MLRLFQYTPAQQALDAATDLYPVYRYRAVIADDSPLMSPPEGLAMRQSDGVNVRLLVASALLLAATLAVIARAGGIEVRRRVRQIIETRGRHQHPDGAPA